MNYICVYIVYLFATNCAIIYTKKQYQCYYMYSGCHFIGLLLKQGCCFFVSFGQEQDHANSTNKMLPVNCVKYLVY